MTRWSSIITWRYCILCLKSLCVWGVAVYVFFVPDGYCTKCSSVDLNVIASIESSNNPNAVGDGGLALGLYQLHECVIKDAKRHFKCDYSHQDALNPEKAHKIANWYINAEIPRLLRHFRIPDTIENRLIAYNAGIRTLTQGRVIPKITKRYIKKYKEMAKCEDESFFARIVSPSTTQKQGFGGLSQRSAESADACLIGLHT